MMGTIPLLDHLLSRARRHLRCGQLRSARMLLKRLLGFPQLSSDLHAEARCLLGMIWLKRHSKARARRQFTLAVRQKPESARLHYLLGLASLENPRRALMHFERSLERNPHQPRCLVEAGLLALSQGDEELGWQRMRLGRELAPSDVRLLGQQVKGLIQAGRPDEALREVRQALFEAPRCPKVRQLWLELQIKRIRRDQETIAARKACAEAPILLPFIRVMGEKSGQERLVRDDEASSLPGPHLVRLRMRSGRRRTP